MSDLLRADFYRILKNKLVWLVAAMTVLFPLLLAGLYSGLEMLMKLASETPELSEELGGTFSEIGSIFDIRALFAGTFSLSDNFGLVLPIFTGIFVCGDLSRGTLRSKIIIGKSRVSVYLSHLITIGVFAAAMAVLYTVFTLLFTFSFFDFGMDVTGEVIRQICLWAVLGILSFVFCSTISTCLAMSTGNTAATILISLAVCLALGLANSLCSILETKEAFRDILYLIPGYGSIRGLDITAGHFGLSIASLCFFGAVNTVIGILIFRKKDLK